MKRDKVDSSIIDSIGYDEKKSMLEVEFIDGAIYQFIEVPHREYKSLMDAGSHGKYFLRNIGDRYSSIMVKKGEGQTLRY